MPSLAGKKILIVEDEVGVKKGATVMVDGTLVTKAGAPRTMFKPDEGASYWDKVKAREADGGARGSRSRCGPASPSSATSRRSR